MTPQEWASTIQGYLLLAATFWGVYVAAKGLDTWKKQLTGSAEWKLARRFLRRVLTLRDTLVPTPSPIVTAVEMAHARETLGVEDSPKDRAEIAASNDDLIAAYQVRRSRVADAFSAYRVEELEAEVLWGSSAMEATKDLNRVVQELRSQFERHIWDLHTDYSEGRRNRGETVFNSSDHREKFQSELKAAVEKAETFGRQKLKR